MVDMIADRDTHVVAAKIVHLVRSENLRLIDSGADLFTVGETLLNGSIAALVSTFRSLEISDDEELVKALRTGLRVSDESALAVQPHH